MRFLFAFLLIPVFAQAALVERNSTLCPDGSYATVGEGECRPFITAGTVGGGLDNDSTNYLATVTVTSGTMYACAYPSENAAPATCADVIAGTGCEATSSKAVTTNAVNLNGVDNLDGLQPSDFLKVASCVRTGVRDSVVDVSAEFQTLSGGGAGGIDLTGTVKIFDPNSTCVSDCDGTTLAKAWDELSDVSGITTGLDFCLMDDSVFEDQRWAPGALFAGEGANGVPNADGGEARLGTCYVDEGDGNKLVWFDQGTGTGRGAKAEINGDYDDVCRNISNPTGNTDFCDFGNANAIPTGTSQGLVQIDGPYVHLTDIVIRDSAGRGVQLNRQPGFRFLRSEMYDIRGVFFHGGGSESKYLVFDESIFRRCGYAASGAYENNGSSNLACFTFARDSHEDGDGPNYGLFTNNFVADAKGELFSLLQTSGWIVRGNVILNGADAIHYVDNGSLNVFEWNIFGYTTDECKVARKNNKSCPTGETIQKLEVYSSNFDNNDNLTRHNLYLYGGLFNMAGIEAGVPGSLTQGKYFIHNTLVNMGFIDRNSSSTLQAGTTARNNAFVGSGSFTCLDSIMQGNAFGVTQGDLNDNCEGANDNYGVSYTFAGGAPEQELFANYTDWSFPNLTITGGAANNSADDLTATNASFISATCTDTFPQLAWANFTPTNGVGSGVDFAFNCTNWRKLGYYNYLGNARSAANDKGF